MAFPLKAQSSSYSPNELLSKNRDIHVRNMINKYGITSFPLICFVEVEALMVLSFFDENIKPVGGKK